MTEEDRKLLDKLYLSLLGIVSYVDEPTSSDSMLYDAVVAANRAMIKAIDPLIEILNKELSKK